MADDQQLYDVWWNDRVRGEQAMEDNHQPHWKKVISMIEEADFSSFHVLDFGCNQGGFLRYLYTQKPFLTGTGVDLAKQSIEVANARKKDLPLSYEATAHVDKFNHAFDIAFSISVIYLIQDLTEHAWKMKQALKPGGVYYCTYTDYSKNPSLLHYKKQIDRHGSLPMQLHSLNEIADAFFHEGFKVELRRMPPLGYITIDPNDMWFNAIADRMQYEYQEAYIFRFTALE
ncbi:bifunctional 2-polyprenyl-6-hydroxyphenol methylase/3-demethylubiquinol 3-O-methyltransferase UbiG [Paenibacillus macerans]|uniref:class I SAM-dependent methyltransferase n=1 Tax=Paenibacillus macerans TaxID=44252 RepID=UPI00203B4EBB|nr:class I SAM-dependent methyltransferase [Paenibacillus macerans]MCM3701625.1 class I SAM-dependent methyltransferase [Paenibacillus macerans]